MNSYLRKQSAGDPSSFEIEKFLKNLVDVAYQASESTSKMRPMVGRASYVDPSLVTTPDAGASAISFMISSIYKAFIISANKNN